MKGRVSVTAVKWKVKRAEITKLTLFAARKAEECYLCIPTFSFLCFSEKLFSILCSGHVSWKQHTLEKSLDETVLKSEFRKQDGLHLFPFVPRTFDLRCSQLSCLIEEFVRLTFVTFVHFFSTVFSPYFSFASECFAYFGLLCKRCILWFQGFHLHEMKHINPKYFTGCFSSFCFAWYVIDFFPPLWSAQCVICDPWSLHTLYSLHTYLPYFVTSFLSASLCDRLHSAERIKAQWDSANICHVISSTNTNTNTKYAKITDHRSHIEPITDEGRSQW